MNPNNQPPQNQQEQLPQEGQIIQPGQPLPQAAVDATKLRKKDIAIVVIALAVIIAIISTIVYFIGAPGRERAYIEKNGIEATAISTGESKLDRTRLSSKTRVERLKAYYTFTAKDGREYRVLGEKDYEEESNIKAGMKATIRYLEDKPTKPEFITEE